MKSTSIKDIAKIAGVSVATVSYVLNKKEGQKISEATKARILQIAKDINYQPNKAAKGLKTSKSKLLGLVVADISNEFYSTLARKIENEALKLGYSLIIGSSDENAEKFQMLVELFSQQQVDGLIIAPVAGSEKCLNDLVTKEYPVVMVDRFIEEVKIPAIVINNKEISKKATQKLIEKNFDTLVYIGYKTSLAHLLDRERGFDEAVSNAENHSRTEKLLVGLKGISEEIQDGLQVLLGSKPKNTALYFSSNKLAVSGLKYLLQNDIKVPQDVSVLAFDETEAYSLFPTKITFLQQPLDEMAGKAVEVLDALIGHYQADGAMTILSSELIEGESIK